MNFVIGIICGAVSGGVTYYLSGSMGLAVVAGLIVMVLGFLGFISYLFISD